MRALVQRVRRAVVTSRDDDGEWVVAGAIGIGLCVFVGVTHDDDRDRADRLAAKLWGLRILDDGDGVMNRSLQDRLRDEGDEGDEGHEGDGSGENGPVGILVVSQFTLYGDTRRGRRPSWAGAAPPDLAEPLVERVVDRLRELGGGDGLHVATGRFRTEMEVELVNDGPVTLVIDV